MRSVIRQFSSIPKGKPGAPLITFDKATIYPLGETVSPYFTNLTWKIHESETWAVIGPSSSGRRVLLEVSAPLNLQFTRSIYYKESIDVLLLPQLNIPSCNSYNNPATNHVRYGQVMLFIIYDLILLLRLLNSILNGTRRIEKRMILL